MVGIVTDRSTEQHPVIRSGCLVPEYDRGGGLSEIQTFSLGVERPAGLLRQGLERLET